MVIIDPYLTTYGKLVNKEKTVKDIQRYIVGSTNENLNYEYANEGSCKLVFIVGYDQNEKELPSWWLPILFKDIRGNMVIAVDLRKYVKSVNEAPMNISDIVRDSASCTFLINTALIMSDFINEDYGKYRPLFNGAAAAYSGLVSSIVNGAITLNPVEKFDVEVAAAYFLQIMLCPSIDIEDYIPSINARLVNMKFSLATNMKIIESVTSKCNPKLTDLSGLIANLKTILPEEKAELVDSNVFVNLLSNIWHGPGANETVVIGLESSAVWLSLVYSCLSDHTFKRSRLATILDKHNKYIGGKEYIKNMELILKDKIL